VGHRAQLGEGAAARSLLLALLNEHVDLATVGRFEILHEAFDSRAVVPDVKLIFGCVTDHPPSVRVDGSSHRGVSAGPREPVLPSRHHEARGETRHVPLERPGQRLVEVAQVEVEVALGCGPEPEVQDMGVAAELHLQTTVRTRGEVGRHHRGAAPVVVPW
jgi:hypothetical protein